MTRILFRIYTRKSTWEAQGGKPPYPYWTHPSDKVVEIVDELTGSMHLKKTADDDVVLVIDDSHNYTPAEKSFQYLIDQLPPYIYAVRLDEKQIADATQRADLK